MSFGGGPDVLAIGPFRACARPCLTHPGWRYDGTRDGAVIVEVVFETPEGSRRSRQLASCFGVDPWDFSAHALDPWRADVEALRAMFDSETAEAASGSPVQKARRGDFHRPSTAACIVDIETRSPWIVDEYPPLEALRAFRDAGFSLHVYPRAPSQFSP